METPKYKIVLAAPGLALDEQNTGFRHLVHRFVDGLLGKPEPAKAMAHIAQTRQVAAAADIPPREIACETEAEAIQVCRDMIARGYSAAVHYDTYDFSWSVEVGPAEGD
ncbi:hypothetical protein [Pseudoduganella umbonata]|uniref:Uncharacterized protein n=1 Tax=Pseudoduganella umbonata TaxID=864828 RepID=A0A4P8HYX6_9BURK|nr:hypothetical protein [Pseudoduganella umbonata]MBB3223488.1 hypothetical protein [Pseudoduganella umbonata]QCP13625.1 hypothetical protein FCL38_26695 [Pseudoduganella umbonata]